MRRGDKQLMKKITLVSILFLWFCATNCKKSNNGIATSNANIMGYDLSTCTFCGGIKVSISGDTTKNAPSFYRTNQSFRAMGITDSSSFPIPVQIQWQRDLTRTAGNYIILTQVKIIR
ncbi:hypothetical protein BDE36_0377 [Arcticibacter tournemirensis]|uniref:Uncharacterized protein n=1 Tax=Arcticibacter tournemirensis TaxID=699437 RepID=A0A5M9HJI0_9SPHI|nr:hypothetical protein [Arcticibacter tournemirensis]KAA8485594.1 hypothetical protein F1649_03685 [Arcticibacter tournemirensis]TQM48688.1 hypothetical protein BDE36_0377 [Arcticibacter tournemirensis]